MESETKPLAEQYFDRQAIECHLDDALMAACGADPDKVDTWPAGDFGYDPYDSSFELWGTKNGWLPTIEQLNAVMDLGFTRGWICYQDGTERYCVRGGIGELVTRGYHLGDEEKRQDRQHRRHLAALEREVERLTLDYKVAYDFVKSESAEVQRLFKDLDEREAQLIEAREQLAAETTKVDMLEAESRQMLETINELRNQLRQSAITHSRDLVTNSAQYGEMKALTARLAEAQAQSARIEQCLENEMRANAQLCEEWRCFHCEFATSDAKEAAAHFGDRDDESPICVTWKELNADGKLAEFQQMFGELESERDESNQLRMSVETLEYRLSEYENLLSSRFKNCRTLNDAFNLFDSVEGRMLAAEEKIVEVEKERDSWKAEAEAKMAPIDELLEPWVENVDSLRVQLEGATGRERAAFMGGIQFSLYSQKERGKVLTGSGVHFCNDWDGLTVDETTEEWGNDENCRCGFAKRPTPSAPAGEPNP